MCGICGIAGYREDELVRRMTDTMSHRGPDDSGCFLHDGLSLGMRRLSIIDLSLGHQPMLNEDGRVAVVFNGEIYNFQHIRRELEAHGHVFRTRSDTEVILAGYLAWGLRVLDRLNGMFAIGLADLRGAPTLYLIRDRFGVKPLYYHFSAGRLTFASEIKSILESARIPRRVDRVAVDSYLRLRYVPGDTCMLQGIRKLPAGSFLSFRQGQIRIERYWEVPFFSEKANISAERAEDELGSLLRQSVKRRLIADVPVGAFLSGGVDSSVIVALMRESNAGDLHTFSIGFGSEADETHLAAKTAASLGTRHHAIQCSDSDFDALEKIAWHLDEPIGDAIVVPMFLLAREARRHVKVVLAGEGADEIFGGYLFQKVLAAAGGYRRAVPQPLRRLVLKLMAAVPHPLLNLAFAYPARLGSAGKKRLLDFMGGLETRDLMRQFHHLISLFTPAELETRYQPDFLLEREAAADRVEASGLSVIDSVLSLQFKDWLPDDILMKLDKMTMANSLEGREPYLDHELVHFVNGLPDAYKIRGWSDKRLLRRFAGRLLPRHTALQPKRPFYIPMDRYMSGPTFARLFEQFRDENHLAPIFRSDYLASLDLASTDFLKCKQLFSLMMLNSWLSVYKPGF